MKQDVSFELSEKKSKFICNIFTIDSIYKAEKRILEIKKKYNDARHNVFAYIVQEKKYKKFSDDGEPQGTAGKPILYILEKNELSNVCCVITRYFGGILLGVGGLIRAYSGACMGAIDKSGVILMKECYVISILSSYNFYNIIINISENYSCDISDRQFTDKVLFNISIVKEETDKFIYNIVNLSNNMIEYKILGSIFLNL
ncbi:MAG: YigZ family protein [Oscillospiraceae bacterium]|nr:YigZ family protein [Oscillospiraceae bacterium]